MKRQLLVCLALPVAYVVTGGLGLMVTVPPGYATPVFLPAGLAITACFIAGLIALPGTFVGSFLLNMWIGYLIVGDFDLQTTVAALIVAGASMMQAAVGGTTLRWTIGYPAPFCKVTDIPVFFMLAPILCLTSVSLSLYGLWEFGVIKSSEWNINWLMWWLGDTLGLLVSLPLLIWFGDEPLLSDRQP